MSEYVPEPRVARARARVRPPPPLPRRARVRACVRWGEDGHVRVGAERVGVRRGARAESRGGRAAEARAAAVRGVGVGVGRRRRRRGPAGPELPADAAARGGALGGLRGGGAPARPAAGRGRLGGRRRQGEQERGRDDGQPERPHRGARGLAAARRARLARRPPRLARHARAHGHPGAGHARHQQLRLGLLPVLRHRLGQVPRPRGADAHAPQLLALRGGDARAQRRLAAAQPDRDDRRALARARRADGAPPLPAARGPDEPDAGRLPARVEAEHVQVRDARAGCIALRRGRVGPFPAASALSTDTSPSVRSSPVTGTGARRTSR